MSETKSHKQAKAKAAGKSGKTEVHIPGNRSLDAASAKKATEVERSGTQEGLEKAASRLKASGKSQKILQVPQKDMAKATKAMKNVGVGGTVKNMGGTKRRSVILRDGITGKASKRSGSLIPKPGAAPTANPGTKRGKTDKAKKKQWENNNMSKKESGKPKPKPGTAPTGNPGTKGDNSGKTKEK